MPVLALLQEAPLATSGTAAATVRVIAGICALAMAFMIIFRRKNRVKKEKEDGRP